MTLELNFKRVLYIWVSDRRRDSIGVKILKVDPFYDTKSLQQYKSNVTPGCFKITSAKSLFLNINDVEVSGNNTLLRITCKRFQF